MKIYNVPKGIHGKIIIQEEDKDVEILDFTTRKNSEFSGAKVIMDDTFPPTIPAGTRAAQLRSEGYAIFSAEGRANSRYLLAVKMSDIGVYHG